MQRDNRGSLQNIVLDEIALEGLEGITLPSLWVYLGKALNIELPLPGYFIEQIWQFILKVHEHLEFFHLPKERATIISYERYKVVDADLGIPITPEICPLVRYKFVPINDGNIMGSCEYYKERESISYESIQKLTAEQILKKYGKTFVIVANQKLRYNALVPENVLQPKDLTPVQYAIWEAIGRARQNGETTAGLWSLQNLCKDSATVFYIKNKLLRQNVISSQLFNEKRGERLIVSTLLTLPRFYETHRSRLMAIIEKMFLTLKDQPDYRMSVSEIRNRFTFDSSKTLKKVMLTHLFRRIFETQSVCYFEMNKNAKPKTKDQNSKNRTVAVLVLRNPERTLDDLFTDLENETDKNNDGENSGDNDFHDDKHALIDMHFREEFYQCLLHYGSRGASQNEIYHHMSTNYLALRQLLKNMSAEGSITSYVIDAGRQRRHMYVAIEHSESLKKSRDCSQAVLKSLQCNDEPNLPKQDVILSDIPQISARIKPCNFEIFLTQRESNTQKLLTRKTFCVRMINEQSILSILTLRKAMQAWEKEQGATDEVCRKTLRRLLCHMNKCKIINLYEIILQCGEQVRLHRYVTHPKIDAEHSALKYEVLKLKSSFFLVMEEKRLRQLSTLKFQKKQQQSLANSGGKMHKDSLTNKSKDPIKLKSQKPPKFLISRYIHEFLFYIIIELGQFNATYDITPELLQYWKEQEPSLNIQEYLKQYQEEDIHLKAYTKDISWRTFIPPLPHYPDKPVGWVCFTDAIDRMPLSIFNKVFRLDKGADERLSDYISHPIRQHYLMRQLPADLHCKIMRIQLQRVYISVLKLLNHMNLIQVNERSNIKDPLVMWIYFNRKACILDTTTSDISYKHINTDREYVPIHFEFCNFDDVHNYWTTLQRICVYTKLGFRRGIREVSKRTKQLEFLQAVDFDEAPAYDNSKLPGDGLGAAGLSSNLFAHTFRNWSWSIQAKIIRNIRTGRTVGSGSTGAVASANTRTGTSVKTIKLHRKRKIIQTVKGCATKITTTATSASTPITSIVKANSIRKKYVPDAIDRDALKNMRSLRVKWNSKEDEILLIAKTAHAFLGVPVASLAFIHMGKICRDVIRHTLGINNKTTQACIRRIRFLVTEKRHTPHVPTWLHLLQTDEYIQKKYGEKCLEKLRKIYPERQNYTTAIMRHFTLIMWHLYKLIHNDNNNETPQKYHFIIPDTIQEFMKCYLERKPVETDDDVVAHKNPETTFDIQTNMVVNVLHSSLCSLRDKTLFNLQAFEIYKSFSEDVLEAAFAKARNDSMVTTIKRRNMNLLPSQMTGPQYLLSSKYRSRLLYLCLPYSVYDGFYTFYESLLKHFYGSSNHNHNISPSTSLSPLSSAKCVELKSPTLGQLFVIGECSMRNLLNTNIKLPINMLTVDAEQNPNKSSIDRTLDHFQNIFENAPETEYTKNIDIDVNEKAVRVKFHPANLSYKLHYAPYDFIAKLPSRYLHFFCALNQLNKDVDINFNKLYIIEKEVGEREIIQCPFSMCILMEDNYLNAIERIVNDKREMVNSLKEIQPQKLLHMATNGQQLSMKVDEQNLLTLVRMLESFWQEKESLYEHMDLGKIYGNIKMAKPTDWCQLCRDIVTFDNNEDDYYKIDEYEATLNKEERIMRAQDVFVVNLPTIQLKIAHGLKKGNHRILWNETIKYNGFNVPKILLETNAEAILQRIINESLWHYTENDLDKVLSKAKEQIGLNEQRQKHLIEVHNYIKNHSVGVSITDLMDKFQNDKTLWKSIEILSDAFLIKRVGIHSFMYVHKNHIRPWLIHTFNLKRLDRENIGGSTAELKRQYVKEMNENYEKIKKQKKYDHDDKSLQEFIAESCKIEVKDEMEWNSIETIDDKDQEASCSTLKRTIRPIKRYENEIKSANSSNGHSSFSALKERDMIVMRPVPWIRLNGSLNRRALDRWIGSILNECLIRTGCTVRDICARFPHMLPVDIMILLEILSQLKCIQLRQISTEVKDIDLFTEYKPLKDDVVTSIYDANATYIRTQSDAIMRLSLFIGNKKYKAEFI